METRTYHITMLTELGPRRGKLTLDRCGKGLSGVLTILSRENRLSGAIVAPGQLHVTGTLHTMLTERPFTMDGTVTDGDVKLTLVCGRHHLPVFGRREGAQV